MNPPSPYPRTPHLLAPAGRTARWVLDDAEARAWLSRPVNVEEKLDGANVSIWFSQGALQVAARGGLGTQDRGGQLGRLRAWAAQRRPDLHALLGDDTALYGEWLWRQHGVRYDLLPDWLVVLDLWTSSEGLLPTGQRSRRCSLAGFVEPPPVFEGTVGSVQALTQLVGPARWSTKDVAEGLVLRDGLGGRCKYVAPGHRRPSNSDWQAGLGHNQLELPLRKVSRGVRGR